MLCDKKPHRIYYVKEDRFKSLFRGLFFVFFLSSQSCAILQAPFRTRHQEPSLHLDISHALPSKLVLNLRADSVKRMGESIVIFRALGEAEFLAWKSIPVRDFEKPLLRGILLVDSELKPGDDVSYLARAKKDDKNYLSKQVYFMKKEGPAPPDLLTPMMTAEGLRVSWRPRGSFSHVIVYRRNILDDSPVEIMSELLSGTEFLDRQVKPGVYTYQLVSVSTENRGADEAFLEYGPLSEPVYVTVEPDMKEKEQMRELTIEKEIR